MIKIKIELVEIINERRLEYGVVIEGFSYYHFSSHNLLTASSSSMKDPNAILWVHGLRGAGPVDVLGESLIFQSLPIERIRVNSYVNS